MTSSSTGKCAKRGTEEFLRQFREFEQALRMVYGDSMTVREYEGIDEKNAKKLQICRLLRNYAAHETDMDAFFPVPAETCAFLRSMTEATMSEVETAGERMKRLKALNGTETLTFAAKRLNVCPKMPVIKQGELLSGMFTRETLRRAIASGKDASSLIQEVKIDTVSEEQCVCPIEPASSLSERIVSMGMLFVTGDGKRNGKYLGVLT